MIALFTALPFALVLASAAAADEPPVPRVAAVLEGTGAPIHGLKANDADPQQLVAIDKTGHAIAWHVGRQQRLWEARVAPEGSEDIFYAAFSSTGRHVVVVSCWRGHTALLDSATGDEVVRLERPEDQAEQGYLSVRFSPDDRYVVAPNRPLGVVNVWSAETGRLVTTLRQGNANMFTAGFSDDQRLVYGVSAGYVRVWNAVTGEMIRRIDAPRPTPFEPPPTIKDAVLSSDVRYAAVAVLTRRDQHGVSVMSLESGNTVRWIPLPGTAYRMRFSADLRRLHVFLGSGEWRTVDIATGETVEQWRVGSWFEDGLYWYAHLPFPMDWTPTGERFFTPDARGRIRVWEFAPATPEDGGSPSASLPVIAFHRC